ncbi:Hsp20/alpha crystallin family protein [Desulfobulbus oligotrophicus]|jgi:HSP20 family protein|uniref:Hsp20/alpha crystallin family protein n=1 Tax=Desulfobulbus oligotrophicus TaxID=1909699 RepID=A0A7T5VEC3_9BACT|nr:Hsp20/alpha crystallin family protein [Desulfobulbus oligotrophicus]MDY0390251.1 Hsp20/alpha crystallin family protein [Desulfobulbus oligotrophicus]QQG66251.1 Hsp20/alpha crystallin family protein [Desulfobulbus oligotrophicus]
MTEQELKIQEKKAAQLSGEQTKNELYFAPHVDIYETDQEVIVIADMPGVVTDDLDLSLEDSILTIQGRRLPPAQSGRLILEEYETGHYLRRFTVAETIDQERIAASLTDGVLTVRLPKIQPLQPRKIEVQIG